MRSTEISKSIISANSQNKMTTEKGPVMLLYELFTDISFNCTQTIGPQHAKFKTLVTVNGCQFEGTGKMRLNQKFRDISNFSILKKVHQRNYRKMLQRRRLLHLSAISHLAL